MQPAHSIIKYNAARNTALLKIMQPAHSIIKYNIAHQGPRDNAWGPGQKF